MDFDKFKVYVMLYMTKQKTNKKGSIDKLEVEVSIIEAIRITYPCTGKKKQRLYYELVKKLKLKRITYLQ